MLTEAIRQNPDTIQTPEKIAAESRSNFILSFLFLPKEKREGITHFYALSRVIDDAVDDHPPAEAQALLEFWKKEILLCYEGRPTHPVTQSMQETIRRFNIPKEYLDLLIEGCEWDLTCHRYASLDALNEYCYRVAGSIGLTCMRIFGMNGKEAERAAVELGLALQLTNIVRDVRADIALGRIYLPQNLLSKYGVLESDLLAEKSSVDLSYVLIDLLKTAETHFTQAFSLLRKLPRRPLVAAWIMGRVYFEIFRKIRKDPLRVMREKVSLSKVSKFRIAAKECILALI